MNAVAQQDLSEGPASPLMPRDRRRRFRRWSAMLATALLAGMIAGILLRYTQYALVSPPSFDGGMNLNTAWSFVHGHGYGFLYDVFYPFPAETDGPFILPAGLLMLAGGVTPFTTQGVNLGYLFGFAVATGALSRKLLGSLPCALVATTVALLTPGLFPYGMDGYGEIPTLFWFLATLLILAPAFSTARPSPRRLFAGGVTLGLCLVTKVIALLMVAPAAGLFLLLSAQHLRSRAVRTLWFVTGAVLPVAGWELFRLVEVGGVAAYAEWWRLQLDQVRLQSGAAETLGTSGVSWTVKGAYHLHALAGLTGLPMPLLVCFLGIPWLAAAAWLFRRWRCGDLRLAFCLASILSASFLYFFWWLLVAPAPMVWLRRILDGLLLQQMLVAVSLAAAASVLATRTGRALPAVLLSCCTLAALTPAEAFVLAHGETLSQPMATAAGADELALAAKLRALPPDAVLFGFGWWRAPVLALFSGRTMMDLYHWDPAAINALPHKYLVLDGTAVALADPAALRPILAASTRRILAEGPGGTLYALSNVLPFPPFTDQDRSSKQLAPGFDAAQAPYLETRGMIARGRAMWAQPDAALLLRRKDETQLAMSICVPPQLLAAAAAAEPLRLRVTSSDCLDSTVPIDLPGMWNIVLPVTCPAFAAAGPMEVSLRVNGHLPFVRQIEADQRRRAFLMLSAQLTGPEPIRALAVPLAHAPVTCSD